MRMTVLNVAYPFSPIGGDAVGGAEQILGELDRALVAAGHVSLVAACEGSQPAGKLFAGPLPTGEQLDAAAQKRVRESFQLAIDRALATHRVDLIHFHGFDFHEYSWPMHIPALVTLHLPLSWYPQRAWIRARGRIEFLCVSDSQKRDCPRELAHTTVLENGVALPSATNRPRSDYGLVLGRICPEKNQHAAVVAGTLAHKRVLLGGRVFRYPDHERYFHDKLEPLLWQNGPKPRHEFLGPLSGERKLDLLARARCLLHPTLAPETSSLVAMEAMAAGTPVIAYRSGALTDIVEDGVTGFLVSTVAEMADAMQEAGKLDPQVCRETARRRFSRDRMIGRYFELYRQLVRECACSTALSAA